MWRSQEQKRVLRILFMGGLRSIERQSCMIQHFGSRNVQNLQLSVKHINYSFSLIITIILLLFIFIVPLGWFVWSLWHFQYKQVLPGSYQFLHCAITADKIPKTLCPQGMLNKEFWRLDNQRIRVPFHRCSQ